MYYLYVDNHKILQSFNRNKLLKEASHIEKACVEAVVIKNLKITKNEESCLWKK